MKLPTLLLTVLLVPAAYAQPFAPLSEALKSPESAKKIIIRAASDEPQRFHEKAARFRSLESVRIESSASAQSWKQLLNDLGNCPALKNLELSNNDLQVLPEEIQNLEQLQALHISGNSRLHYADAFTKISALPSLKQLQLSGTGLPYLPSEIGQLQQLERLTISDPGQVNLWASSDALSGLRGLKTISLGVRAAAEVPGCIAKLPALEEVQVSFAGNTEPDYSATTRRPGPAVDVFRVPLQEGRSLRVRTSTENGKLDAAEETKLLSTLQGNRSAREAKKESGFRREYKGVKSPLPALDIPQTEFTVDAAMGGVITHSSGTQIYVPANAFVDASGQPLQGEVTISYREFRDQLDFVVSGIPMTYDTGGTTQVFESAGMFEMNASVGEQEVFLAPGKQVDMQFASTDAAPSFNFYEYDAENGGWEVKGKAGKVTKKKKLNADSLVLSSAWRAFGPARHNIPDPGDSTKFDARYANTEDYFYTVKDKKKKVDHKTTIDGRKIAKNRHERLKQLVMLKRVATRSKDSTCFEIVFNKAKHPELNAFSRVRFAVPGKFTYAQFNQLYGRRARFSDIRISGEGPEVQIEMKSYKGFTTVSAALVSVDNERNMHVLSDKRSKEAMKYYTKNFASRRGSFDRRVNADQRGYRKAVARAYRDSLKSWNEIKPLMSEAEAKMDFRSWVNYFKQVKSLRDSIDRRGFSPGNVEVVRSLTIGKFGLYNCDQVENQNANILVMADFRDKDDGGMFASEYTYIINKRKNSILYYDNYHEGSGYTPNRFAFNGGAPNVFLAVQQDGMLAFLDEDEFKKQNENSIGKARVYNVNVVDPDDVSLDQLKERLGIVKK